MKYYKNPKKRFVYIKQYKVGCSSIEEMFDSSNIRLRGFVQTPDELRDNYKEWFKFGIVRNPYDRLVSLYSDKCQKNAKDRIERGDKRLQNCQKVILKALNKPLEVEQLLTISFPEFISVIPMIKNKDLHFNPQSPYFIDMKGNCVADKLIRFENINEELTAILPNLGLRVNSIPHSNSTKHSSYQTYYTDKEINIVRTQYSADLKNFGYQF